MDKLEKMKTYCLSSFSQIVKCSKNIIICYVAVILPILLAINYEKTEEYVLKLYMLYFQCQP